MASLKRAARNEPVPPPGPGPEELGPQDPAAPGAAVLPVDGSQVVVVEGRRYLVLPLDAGAPSAGPGPALPRGWPALRGAAAERLTERELQIALLVADGLVNKQIAAELRISTWTVATHLRRMFAKLGVDTRAAMVCRCAGLLAQRPAAGAGDHAQ